jgi:transketolase
MKLKQRIIDISYHLGLTHIGSCISSVDALDRIYSVKKPDEVFILSNGHAGLALYVVLEKHEGIDAEYLYKKHGVHPNRNLADRIYCSTGSLGQGLPIAVGMALADRSKKVYCMISDGECAEGSIWESLTIAKEEKLDNLKVYLIINGWAAYKEINIDYLIKRIEAFEFPVEIVETTVEQYPFLKGLDAHYCKIGKEDYEKIR